VRGRDELQDFHAVYSRNIERVYRLCRIRLGHREDAEDAAQNVFLRWMRSGKDFDSEEHEKAYFLRAAHNECINMGRSFWRMHRVAFDDLPPLMTAEEEELPAVSSGEILSGLPAKYREVLYLDYYEELKTAEIAHLLDRPESTVRTQLQKGRELLRKLLDQKTGGK